MGGGGRGGGGGGEGGVGGGGGGGVWLVLSPLQDYLELIFSLCDYHYIFYFFYFFFFFICFFQAEDGIRAVAVTGVQTCALPIWCPCTKLRYAQKRDAPQNKSHHD